MKIKNYTPIVMGIMLLVASATNAQTNFVDYVSDLWFAGCKSNVLAIANQRLQQDTNDIAGLLLKLDYDIEFLQFSSFSNTMDRALQVGATITTTNFVVWYPILMARTEMLRGMIPSYPPDQIDSGRAKGNLSGKPLPSKSILKALEKDGYFQ